jgi:hypothetical protein
MGVTNDIDNFIALPLSPQPEIRNGAIESIQDYYKRRGDHLQQHAWCADLVDKFDN